MHDQNVPTYPKSLRLQYDRIIASGTELIKINKNPKNDNDVIRFN